MSQLSIVHLDHCSVIITNVERSRRFYGELLGLREIAKPRTFDFVVIWYDLGDQHLHLLLKEQADTLSARHFALRVADIHAAPLTSRPTPCRCRRRRRSRAPSASSSAIAREKRDDFIRCRPVSVTGHSRTERTFRARRNPAGASRQLFAAKVDNSLDDFENGMDSESDHPAGQEFYKRVRPVYDLLVDRFLSGIIKAPVMED